MGTQFFVSLAGIVVADLALAGDNAVVIALAARNLPRTIRTRAVVLGALCAIVLRAALTVAAVFLLRGNIPFVQLVGGIALLWIGWQLAVQQQEHHDENMSAASTLRGAVRTIIIADVVMSIDNVLAVAAFAKSDPWLAVIGLIISIPIIMGGATLLLKLIDRFPIIVWIGAALIIYVGVELIMQDPVLHDHLGHLLRETKIERFIGAVLGVLFASAAWLVRRSNVATDADLEGDATTVGTTQVSEDPEPRLMLDGTRSDDNGGRS